MDIDISHPDQEWLAEVCESISHWLQSSDEFGPTSQITGSGAIEVVERRFSALHAGRPALMLPSATYGMRSALAALGVKAGDEVLIPSLDWPSTLAAVRSLGAIAVPVPVDSRTLTIDPQAAATLRTAKARVAVACHIHGVPADVDALRKQLPGVSIVEDAAQALGSSIHGNQVGTLGQAAVFSFGPHKQMSAREGAIVLTETWGTWTNLLALTGHPVRQRVGGVEELNFANFSMRPHPLSAIVLAHQIESWRPDLERVANAKLAAELGDIPGLRVIGAADRENASASVPIIADNIRIAALDRYNVIPSGAMQIQGDKPSGIAMGLLLISRRSSHTRGPNRVIYSTKGGES